MRKFELKYGGVTLFFGPGAVEKVGDFVRHFERAVIASGRSSAAVSGALGDVLRLLGNLGIKHTVFSNITPNPWAAQAEELARAVWEEGADAVVAIGGGSVIDAAKLATIVAASGGRVSDYRTGARRAKRAVPLIVVNLTHGTGSEVNKWAVVTFENTREKVGIYARYPDVSVDDPRYTLTLDRRQSICVSLDALYHAYESATGRLSNPLTLTLAESAAATISRSLPSLMNDLKNLELRYEMLYASMIAGIAIDMSRVHVLHAVEHVLSGLEPRLPHGCGLGMLGPRAVYYTHRADPGTSARVLRALAPNIKPSPEYAKDAERAIARFQEEIGFRERLGDYGFSERDVKALAERVLATSRGTLESNAPFQVTSEVVADIIMSAL